MYAAKSIAIQLLRLAPSIFIITLAPIVVLNAMMPIDKYDCDGPLTGAVLSGIIAFPVIIIVTIVFAFDSIRFRLRKFIMITSVILLGALCWELAECAKVYFSYTHQNHCRD
jgi:hypothetical protein